jgi:stearoyl-CoA desaturase (delta-9 desaturase)
MTPTHSPVPNSSATPALLAAPTSHSPIELDEDGAPAACHEPAPEVVSGKLRIVNLVAVIIPFLGLAATAILLWGKAFDWTHLCVFAGMYLITGFGITIGYHRLFTHRAFETNKVVVWILGIAGSMAVEGSIRKWVAVHRCHHQCSDDAGDPHSPHHHGEGFRGLLAGLWHAHMGWLVLPEVSGLSKYSIDLKKDRSIQILSRLFPVWVLVSLALPTLLGGILTLSWYGALLGFLWGGLARVFLVHHVTWSINSICHVWGTRPFRSHDHSRNNLFFGVFGMGEGWHNNHHAFPTSAKHGLRWWELDASYLIIRTLGLVGLAWNIKVPDAARLASKRAH